MRTRPSLLSLLSLDASALLCAVATVVVLVLTMIGVNTAITGEPEDQSTPYATRASPSCQATLVLIALDNGRAEFTLVVKHADKWTATWPADGHPWRDDDQTVSDEGEGVARIDGSGDQTIRITAAGLKDGVSHVPQPMCATRT